MGKGHMAIGKKTGYRLSRVLVPFTLLYIKKTAFKQ
jgi:hypothetical protein